MSFFFLSSFAISDGFYEFVNPIKKFTLLATVELWSRVADQVHWETMVVAVKPIETLPPASKAVSRLSASW